MPRSPTLAYLVASVLFILALRGLCHPETSRQGNTFGMVGMGIAILATLFHHGMDFGGIVLVIAGLAIGGTVGTVLARRIQMTALPQLVAAFHSLVGMAAVFVAAAAFYAPESFGIGTHGAYPSGSRWWRCRSASPSARSPSRARSSPSPSWRGGCRARRSLFAGQHRLNLGARAAAAGADHRLSSPPATPVLFWLIALLSFALGFLLIIPIGGADMPVVVSMLNSYSGWAAAGIGFTIGNLLLIITGALVGASGAILSYIMCKGMNRSIINVLLGGFGTDSGVGGGGRRRCGPAAGQGRRRRKTRPT